MARGPVQAFRPLAAGGATLAVTGTTGSVAVPGNPSTLRVSSLGSGTDCFIEFGTSGVVATTATGLRLPAGVVEVFMVPINATHIAAITATGTNTLYLSAGEGY